MFDYNRVAFAVSVDIGFSTNKNTAEMWVIDSGATHYTCNNIKKFATLITQDDGLLSVTSSNKAEIKGLENISQRVTLSEVPSTILRSRMW